MSNGSRHIFNYQRLPKIKRTLYDSSPNFGPKQQLGWLGHTPLQAMGKECNMILTIGPSFLLIRFWLEMACDAKRACQKIGKFSIKAAPRLQLSTPETEMLPFHSTWKAQGHPRLSKLLKPSPFLSVSGLLNAKRSVHGLCFQWPGSPKRVSTLYVFAQEAIWIVAFP